MEAQELKTSLWQGVEQAGILRRWWRVRRWYGGDWWIASVTLVALILFGVLALVPSLLAPYAYNEEAGPALLAPGEAPQNYILIAPVAAAYTSVESIDDNMQKASDAPKVGSIDPVASRVVGSLRDEKITVRPMRLQSGQAEINAFDALKRLESGEVDALVGAEDEFRPLLAEFSSLEEVGYVGKHYQGGFLMGTTALGYDIFSRLIYGTRTSLIIGLGSALFSMILGVPIGLISGFLGGPLDRLLTLIMDSLYSFPGLILAIAIAAVLGPSVGNIILAIAVLYIPTYFRIVRGQTLSVKEALYIDAARSLGASRRETLYLYVFPNVLASVMVIFSVNVADAILTGAGLSFLGLGLAETIPDWGVDLARGQEFMRSAWWTVTFPGLAIALLTLCFSLLGEALSEILNPRLRRG